MYISCRYLLLGVLLGVLSGYVFGECGKLPRLTGCPLKNGNAPCGERSPTSVCGLEKHFELNDGHFDKQNAGEEYAARLGVSADSVVCYISYDCVVKHGPLRCAALSMVETFKVPYVADCCHE